MVLPGRNFSNPLALALLELRRNLALDARAAPRVTEFLDAIATEAEAFIDNATVYRRASMLRYRRIASARNDDDLRAALPLLWEMALAIEFGDLSDAERKLRDAQEALSKALEDGASDFEIAKLTDELRKAMQEYLEDAAPGGLAKPAGAKPKPRQRPCRARCASATCSACSTRSKILPAPARAMPPASC